MFTNYKYINQNTKLNKLSKLFSSKWNSFIETNFIFWIQKIIVTLSLSINNEKNTYKGDLSNSIESFAPLTPLNNYSFGEIRG